MRSKKLRDKAGTRSAGDAGYWSMRNSTSRPQNGQKDTPRWCLHARCEGNITMGKLTIASVRSLSKPGKYYDQHGLILRVAPGGSKQWIWRGTIRGPAPRHRAGSGGVHLAGGGPRHRLPVPQDGPIRDRPDVHAARRSTSRPSRRRWSRSSRRTVPAGRTPAAPRRTGGRR